ncbi:MAG: DNA repair protein rad50, partial [Peltula sp. TS41687]
MRSETIQFHTPLTLIVGYNGSGKTTIIECLKYATTGDLPPNSKGGAFIHDPKLCGEKEVLAQVKLSFRGTSGAKMVATRSLQLTVKKLTRAQKTLEGSLLMLKDGERTAISSRVAELDQFMPQYLGVSKAILDSVIFCHQDESLWPMSEPATLKKKFDEIFEALKYTKAIDNIKIIRRTQTEELGKYKLLEQQYKIDKDRADRVSVTFDENKKIGMAEKQSLELQADIEVLRGECQALKKEIDQTTKDSDRLWKQAAVFEQIIGTLNGKRIEAQAKQESINDLGKYITIMDESDEWLTSELEKYEERMSALGAHIDSQVQKHEALRQEIDKSRRQLEAKMTEAGKHQAEQSQYERQLARRQVMIKEAARRHSMRGFDMELDDSLIQEFMVRLGKISREQNHNLDRVKREARDELQKAQEVLNQLGEKKSALMQSKDHAKQEIGSNNRKAGAFQADLNRIEMDEGGKAVLESALLDVESRLEKAKREFQAAAWDDKIRSTNEQLRVVEERSGQLNAELIQSTRQAGELARLDFLHKELKDRQRSLQTMCEAYGEKIADTVSSQWHPSTVERAFQSVMDEANRVDMEAQRQRDGISWELEQIEFTLKSNRQSLKKKSKELQDCESRIREAIGDEPELYPDNLAELQCNRDVRKGDVDNFSNMRKFYEDAVKKAKDQRFCQLCRRVFANNKELADFLKLLEGPLSKSGQQTLVDELRIMEVELKNAREAGPSYDAYQRLKTEIPKLNEEIEKLDEGRKTLLAQLEEQDLQVKQRQDVKRELDTMAKNVQTITKYHSDITKLEGQIRELSDRKKDTDVTRTLEEIQEDLAAVGEEARSIKKALTKLTADKEGNRSQMTTLELELRDLRSKLTDASHQLEKKATLVARVEEFRAMNQAQLEAIEQTERDLGQLAPQFAKARTQYEDVRNRGVDKEKELQQEASRLSDSVHQLQTADQDINAYIDKGGPNQLARSQREVERIRDQIGQVEKEQQGITVEVNKARKQRDHHDETKRTISDNLRYRRDVRALEAVNAEIAELEAKNAEVDRNRFVKEAELLAVKHRKLSAEEATKMGAMKSKDDQLLKLIDDWNTDYRDAAQNFKEAHIKVETTKAAVEDLGRYAGALDKAIMKYHTLKMDEINQILEELWKRTYQGTDVDTILIRSDHETAKANRNYNYRVCMVKQDAEMDMRGRCSAGQKVLACILIRLALAECFGTNCGIIALDEPTTNLDRDNIRSLAESLHSIIATRRQQANFQLIVITHDEEFLRYMKCQDFCDHYYRVTRNERQKSIIEKQSIAE